MASFLDIFNELTGGTPHWQAPPPPPTGPLSAGDILGGLAGAGALETAKAVLSPIAAARLALETGGGLGQLGAGLTVAPALRGEAPPGPLSVARGVGDFAQRAQQVGIPQAIAATQFDFERAPEVWPTQKFAAEMLFNPTNLIGTGTAENVAAKAAAAGAPKPILAALEALAKGDTAYTEGVGLGFDALKSAIQGAAAKVPVARTLAQQSTKGGTAERANLVETVGRSGATLGQDLAPGEIPEGYTLRTLFGEQTPKPPGQTPIDLLGDPIVPRTPPTNGAAPAAEAATASAAPTTRAEVEGLLGADRAKHYYSLVYADLREIRDKIRPGLGEPVRPVDEAVDLRALRDKAEALAPIDESLYQRGVQSAEPSRIQGAPPTLLKLAKALEARGATEDQVRTAQLRALTERYGDTLPTTQEGKNFTDAVRARLQQEGRLEAPRPNPLDVPPAEVPPGAPESAGAPSTDPADYFYHLVQHQPYDQGPLRASKGMYQEGDVVWLTEHGGQTFGENQTGTLLAIDKSRLDPSKVQMAESWGYPIHLGDIPPEAIRVLGTTTREAPLDIPTALRQPGPPRLLPGAVPPVIPEDAIAERATALMAQAGAEHPLDVHAALAQARQELTSQALEQERVALAAPPPQNGATLADWSAIAGQTRPGQRAGIPPDLPPAQAPTTPGLPDAPDNLDQVRAALGLDLHPEDEAYFRQEIPKLVARIEARGGEATDAAIKSEAIGVYAKTVGGTWVNTLIDSMPAQANQELMAGFRQQALAAPSSVVQDVIDASVKSLIMYQDLGWTKGQNPLTPDIIKMSRDAWARAASKAPEAAIGPVGDSLLSATAGVVPSSIIRDVITTGEQTAGKGLERLPGKGGQYIRFWRELRTAVDESARTAAYTHGYRDYLATNADALATKLDTAMRPVIGDEATDRLAGWVRDNHGVFQPSALRDYLQTVGPEPPPAATIKEALTILGQERRAALEAGEGFSKKIHFDLVEGRTNADELLQQVTFFHTWATRNLPFYAEVLATHPGLFNALRAYQDTTGEAARTGDYSKNPRLRSGLPLGGPAELVARLFGEGGQIFFNPSRYVGIVQQLDEPTPGARGVTDFGSVINALSQIGLGPNPLLQVGLNTAGLMGARQPGNLLRPSALINGLLQAATGRDVNIENVTGLPQLQRMRPLNALGLRNDPVPSDPAQRVRMRVAQNAAAEGLSPNGPEAIQAYREGANNQRWRAAQQQMGVQRALEALSSLAGVPMPIRTGAERAIDVSSGGLPDVNAAGGNRPYLPVIPGPNAQPGQPLMTFQQRDALLAQRAATGLPLANAYQEALRRPEGEAGGGGASQDAALKAHGQALLKEWATASTARKQAIANNPLDARLLADAFWQQGVNGRSHTADMVISLLSR